jgi:glucokinase
MNKFSIGVDLGGTNLRIAAVDEQGTLVEKVDARHQVSLGRDRVIGDMCDAIERMSDKYKTPPRCSGLASACPASSTCKLAWCANRPICPTWVDYPAARRH